MEKKKKEKGGGQEEIKEGERKRRRERPTQSDNSHSLLFGLRKGKRGKDGEKEQDSEKWEKKGEGEIKHCPNFRTEWEMKGRRKREKIRKGGGGGNVTA